MCLLEFFSKTFLSFVLSNSLLCWPESSVSFQTETALAMHEKSVLGKHACDKNKCVVKNMKSVKANIWP